MTAAGWQPRLTKMKSDGPPGANLCQREVWVKSSFLRLVILGIRKNPLDTRPPVPKDAKSFKMGHSENLDEHRRALLDLEPEELWYFLTVALFFLIVKKLIILKEALLEKVRRTQTHNKTTTDGVEHKINSEIISGCIHTWTCCDMLWANTTSPWGRIVFTRQYSEAIWSAHSRSTFPAPWHCRLMGASSTLHRGTSSWQCRQQQDVLRVWGGAAQRCNWLDWQLGGWTHFPDVGRLARKRPCKKWSERPELLGEWDRGEELWAFCWTVAAGRHQ